MAFHDTAELLALAEKAHAELEHDGKMLDMSNCLQLAIALDIGIELAGHGVAAVFLHPGRLRFIHYREDPRLQGKARAVCMAVLRAAAEIGRFK